MPADRILVVDDEEAIREIVSSMLTNANYNCRQAASGNEALALLSSGEEFELMLSDLMMADLDGIGLLERTKERFPDMPARTRLPTTAPSPIADSSSPYTDAPAPRSMFTNMGSMPGYAIVSEQWTATARIAAQARGRARR